ncbi:hypothetical protein [Alkalibacillus haloalkaliphilus]|uniref:hypothetical protein n=1 Tax=Alkalibacillus haloalkaliphilus TaxID=94136 RepID=UPI0029356F4B|nr:hypothetical protein [Alkalibacillus haloalkaliphilus]MDV2583479.1 hypothetical protein [Alkalibacillus haloalkaliphilus]
MAFGILFVVPGGTLSLGDEFKKDSIESEVSTNLNDENDEFEFRRELSFNIFQKVRENFDVIEGDLDFEYEGSIIIPTSLDKSNVKDVELAYEIQQIVKDILKESEENVGLYDIYVKSENNENMY